MGRARKLASAQASCGLGTRGGAGRGLLSTTGGGGAGGGASSRTTMGVGAGSAAARLPLRGGVRVAYASTELLFACIESHRRGGARVEIPLKNNPLRFIRRDRAPRQPRYAP